MITICTDNGDGVLDLNTSELVIRGRVYPGVTDTEQARKLIAVVATLARLDARRESTRAVSL